MTGDSLDPGSFRDPAGHVYDRDGRVFRTITARAAADYEFVRGSAFLPRVTERGWFVGAQEVAPGLLGPVEPDVRWVVEHPRIPFVSYPYEWPFASLQAAALLHLDLHLEALAHDVTLVDASAYNVQFRGPRPIFIDLLSFRRYRPGEYWLGHRQFCEQFLNPLLLRSLLGVPHNAWYRGTLEGITAAELSRLLPLRRKLSWNVLSHVVLPARLQRAALDRPAGRVRAAAGTAAQRRQLPREALHAMLAQLRGWIARLAPADTGKTTWGDYEHTHGYSTAEEEAKHAFVRDVVGRMTPALLWDLGCNTGEYAETALAAGARSVVGFDFDVGVLERAFARARAKDLAFLPLWLDAANPSPDQGWNLRERRSLHARAGADMLLALAFVHHLAIGRNVPLARVVDWVVGLAPTGVIEFVPKEDPAVQTMLALREDVFDDYDEACFRAALERQAEVVRDQVVSASGRRLFLYRRR